MLRMGVITPDRRIAGRAHAARQRVGPAIREAPEPGDGEQPLGAPAEDVAGQTEEAAEELEVLGEGGAVQSRAS
jgi:hypothetical protein